MKIVETATSTWTICDKCGTMTSLNEPGTVCFPYRDSEFYCDGVVREMTETDWQKWEGRGQEVKSEQNDV